VNRQSTVGGGVRREVYAFLEALVEKMRRQNTEESCAYNKLVVYPRQK
jgi:hypothetical protein